MGCTPQFEPCRNHNPSAKNVVEARKIERSNKSPLTVGAPLFLAGKGGLRISKAIRCSAPTSPFHSKNIMKPIE